MGDMISLDSNVIGTIESDLQARQADLKETMEEANRKKGENKKKAKNKMRGRNKIGKKIKRKQQNVIGANTEKWKNSLKEQEQETKRKLDEALDNEGDSKGHAPPALKR